MKARLAECILKAAAEGHMTHNELVRAPQTIFRLFSRS